MLVRLNSILLIKKPRKYLKVYVLSKPTSCYSNWIININHSVSNVATLTAMFNFHQTWSGVDYRNVFYMEAAKPLRSNSSALVCRIYLLCGAWCVLRLLTGSSLRWESPQAQRWQNMDDAALHSEWRTLWNVSEVTSIPAMPHICYSLLRELSHFDKSVLNLASLTWSEQTWWLLKHGWDNSRSRLTEAYMFVSFFQPFSHIENLSSKIIFDHKLEQCAGNHQASAD